MAIFGNNGVATLDAPTGDVGYIILGKYTLSETGTLTELSVLIDNPAAVSHSAKVLLYDDDGAGGIARTLLYCGNSCLIGAASESYAQGTPTNRLNAGNYWLGAVLEYGGEVDSEHVRASSASGGSHGLYDVNCWAEQPPTLPSFSSTGTYNLIAFATYTPDSAPPVRTFSIQFGF
jgi:hypothetical protein